MKLKQIPVSHGVFAAIREQGGESIKAFTDGTINILHSIDPVPFQSLIVSLLHVSISHPDRYPSWEEIRAVKDELFGDRQAMMIMPEKALYVNFHKNCFHLWEMPFRWECM